jgi:hypothetical protein
MQRMLEALRAENSQDSKADSLIRALRHIIEFHSGLLIRHLDLRLTPGSDCTGMTGTFCSKLWPVGETRL